MRTITVEHKIYKFEELSEEAKKSVKRWYLENQEPDFFTEQCEQDLENLFGENDLKVQYSLASCQGDGFNIYGEISAENIFKYLENDLELLEKHKNILTDKEKRTILHYQEVCEDIKLPSNNHYCYSLSDRIDIVDNWEYDLEYNGYKNVNKEVLEKFERLVRDIFGNLCKSYEKQGYEFFYEISDEDLEETCNANEWEFYEDGEIY